MGNLVPGNLKPSKPPNPASNATDYLLFTNSLADEIEKQLDAMIQLLIRGLTNQTRAA